MPPEEVDSALFLRAGHRVLGLTASHVTACCEGTAGILSLLGQLLEASSVTAYGYHCGLRPEGLVERGIPGHDPRVTNAAVILFEAALLSGLYWDPSPNS